MNTTTNSPIEAVIFDWAGTLVDFGSFAPTQVLIDAFAGMGISISLDEARVPMGLAKWDHIKALGALPAVAARWEGHFGEPMSDADVDAIYARFMPMQIERVGDYSQAIEGATTVLASLRTQGIRIGSCSGYPRAVMDTLLPIAVAQGIEVEHAVATDDLPPGGRPGPWMALANVIALGVKRVDRCVKIDDTAPGIEEGRAAGMWTVGLTLSGNETGKLPAELAEMSDADIDTLRTRAGNKLLAAGAHEIIDSIAALPAAMARIGARIAAGEKP